MLNLSQLEDWLQVTNHSSLSVEVVAWVRCKTHLSSLWSTLCTWKMLQAQANQLRAKESLLEVSWAWAKSLRSHTLQTLRCILPWCLKIMENPSVDSFWASKILNHRSNKRLKSNQTAMTLRLINYQQWLKVYWTNKPNLKTSLLHKNSRLPNSKLRSLRNLLQSVNNEPLRLNRRDNAKLPAHSPKEPSMQPTRTNKARLNLRKILTPRVLQKSGDLTNKRQNKPNLMQLKLKLRKLDWDRRRPKSKKLKRLLHRA